MNRSTATLFVVTLLFVHEYLDSKYLLVNIREQTIAKLINNNDGKMAHSMIGLYREDRSYPETVQLKDRYFATCKNEKLKVEKSFTVKMVSTKKKFIPWKFTAVLGNDELSVLYADDGGICNLVETNEVSQGCGLATTLMEFCFTDDKVGGMDVQNIQKIPKHIREILQKNEKRREMAIKNCEHIVYLECAPLKDPSANVCSGYLTAAINTEHTMMFVQKMNDDTGDMVGIMDVMKVADVQPELKKNADVWIKNYGREWFFCQCKTERMAECQQMS